MSSRGETTRERILESACELFAETGFAGTTTQDICAKAEANVAAVNYHFRSKENLYREVWAHLHELAMERWTRNLEGAATAEEKLRAFIRLRVESILSSGPESRLPRIIHWEMGQPTALHEELGERYMHRKRMWFTDVVRQVVGDTVDDHTVRLAGFCIQSPLIHLSEMKMRPAHVHRRKHTHSEADPEALVETLCTFALAGLRELARQRNGRVPSSVSPEADSETAEGN